MQVTITSNAAEINRRLSNMVARQLPYAIAKGLNDTAKTLVAKNKQDMKLAFRNPVPFTLNAYHFKYAKRGETSVTIQRKNMQAGRHYLEVQEAGGQVTDAMGNPLRLEKSSLVASNGRLHEVAIEITSRHHPTSEA